MRVLFLFGMVFSLFIVKISIAGATTYYVDSGSCGTDSNNGTSSTTPWKSLAKVNSITYQPGDRILFKTGGVWSGQLAPMGSGTASNPIRIDKYQLVSGPCHGGTSKPIINGNGISSVPAFCLGGAVSLINQHHWEIFNLEVTNSGPQPSPPAARTGQYIGIKAANCTGGVLEHIYIRNNNVHSVNGIVNGFYGTNAGIAIVSAISASDPEGGPQSRWNGVRIDGNAISSVERIGIYVGPHWQSLAEGEHLYSWNLIPRSSNIEITNNVVDEAGGDAVLVYATEDVFISHNIASNSGIAISGAPSNNSGFSSNNAAGIWTAQSARTTIQNNEVFNQRGGFDGFAFDSDHGSTDQLIQYNYSHNNVGFHAIFELGGAATLDNIRVRYNISYGDLERVFYVFCGLTYDLCSFPQGNDRMDINNNVVYVPEGLPVVDVFQTSSGGTLYGAARVYNNIYFHGSEVRYAHMVGGANFFSKNMYFGYRATAEPGTPTQVAEFNKLRCNPRLADPETEAFGRLNATGMKLLADSPAIHSGFQPGMGVDGEHDLGPIDYWGNVVSSVTIPNRGAYNGPGVHTFSAPNLAMCSVAVGSHSNNNPPFHYTNVTDGQIDSLNNTYGYSSQPVAGATCSQLPGYCVDQCVERIELTLPMQRWFDKVVLHPRNDALALGAGHGFPRDFKIQVWNGASWLDEVVMTNVPSTNDPLPLTWGTRAFTNKVRLCATKLNIVATGSAYGLELAEFEVMDTNLAIGAQVVGSSTYELEGWGQSRLTDGRRESVYNVSMGHTSSGHTGPVATESVEVTFPSPKTFSNVVLYPRTDAPHAGAGFPVDFQIQAWNGTSYVTLVSRSNYALVGGAIGQNFTWGTSATTTKIRVVATKLGLVGVFGYYLQLAELEVSQ